MTRPQPEHHGNPSRTFLIERYLSPAAATDLVTLTARLAGLCAEASPDGAGVEYLYSAYLPTEDTCFCLFRAPSADAVEAVNQQVNFTFDRLTDAVLMVGGQTDTAPIGPAPT